jgi:predicted transcriptional regulator
MISELDYRILNHFKEIPDRKKYSEFKKNIIAERKNELLANITKQLFSFWEREVLVKNANTVIALEEAIFYSIKNEWSDYAECYFDYEKRSIVLKDSNLGMELVLSAEGY